MNRYVWCFVKYRHIRVFNVLLNLLPRSIESFDDARFRFRVVSEEVMDAVLLQQSLNGPIQKFESLICLQRLWPAFGERAFQRRHQRCCGLVLQRTHQATFVKTSITVRRKVIPSLSAFKFYRSTRSACHC